MWYICMHASYIYIYIYIYFFSEFLVGRKRYFLHKIYDSRSSVLLRFWDRFDFITICASSPLLSHNTNKHIMAVYVMLAYLLLLYVMPMISSLVHHQFVRITLKKNGSVFSFFLVQSSFIDAVCGHGIGTETIRHSSTNTTDLICVGRTTGEEERSPEFYPILLERPHRRE